ncbi:hypothetical protein LTR53_014108, partial [Teratosphaeriaceae sp. CCFEE 6253]
MSLVCAARIWDTRALDDRGMLHGFSDFLCTSYIARSSDAGGLGAGLRMKGRDEVVGLGAFRGRSLGSMEATTLLGFLLGLAV